MGRWVREEDETPDRFRASLFINTNEHPELVAMILAAPFRSATQLMIDLMEEGMRARGQDVPIRGHGVLANAPQRASRRSTAKVDPATGAKRGPGRPPKAKTAETPPFRPDVSAPEPASPKFIHEPEKLEFIPSDTINSAPINALQKSLTSPPDLLKNADITLDESSGEAKDDRAASESRSILMSMIDI